MLDLDNFSVEPSSFQMQDPEIQSLCFQLDEIQDPNSPDIEFLKKSITQRVQLLNK